jgi:hypothetical protein
MKHIKDLTEQDCIHCATQEEFNAVLMVHNPNDMPQHAWELYESETCIIKNRFCMSRYSAEESGYTIHPASDFLTPQVSVLTEIGDCKVIRHNDGCIVIKDDKAMTLTKDIVNWIKENI